MMVVLTVVWKAEWMAALKVVLWDKLTAVQMVDHSVCY